MLASVVTGIAILLFGGSNLSSHSQKQEPPKKENVQFLAQNYNRQQQQQLNAIQDQLQQQQTQQQIQNGYDAMNRNSSGSWIAPQYQYKRP